jgi:hypothetical protein
VRGLHLYEQFQVAQTGCSHRGERFQNLRIFVCIEIRRVALHRDYPEHSLTGDDGGADDRLGALACPEGDRSLGGRIIRTKGHDGAPLANHSLGWRACKWNRFPRIEEATVPPRNESKQVLAPVVDAEGEYVVRQHLRACLPKDLVQIPVAARTEHP